MNRTQKNIFSAIVIIFACCAIAVTVVLAQKNLVPSGASMNSNQMGTPPEKPNGESGNQMGEPPEKPDGESGNQMGEPPEKPDGESGNQMGEPPEKPDGENDKQMGAPPEKPDGENDKQMGAPPEKQDGESDSQMGTPPEASSEEQTKTASLTTPYYVALGIESFILSCMVVYLIVSVENKKTLKETFAKTSNIIIFILIMAIATALLTYGLGVVTEKYLLTYKSVEVKAQGGESGGLTISQSITSSATVGQGATTITDTQALTGETFSSENSSENALLVKDGGKLTLSNATITKTGDASDENSNFYGTNSGILANNDGTINIEDSKITTKANYANGVFSYGSGNITISNTEISTEGNSSGGIMVAGGGMLTASNLTVNTQGNSSAAIRSDRGGGTEVVNEGTYNTNGKGSPVIYSTANVTVNKITGTATNSQAVVIEGKNSVILNDSNVTASGKGNRNDVDNCGIMIYQSMSGDASVGTGSFTANNSTIALDKASNYYKTAPMFFVTNTDAIINLTNTKLEFGSGVLLSIKGTSEWGKSGSNGGKVTFNAEDQKLEGNVEIDNVSTLELNLKNSDFKGSINSENTAKEVKLVIDSDSTLILTGDTYVTSLEYSDDNHQLINFNGYKLFVNGQEIN